MHKPQACLPVYLVHQSIAVETNTMDLPSYLYCLFMFNCFTDLGPKIDCPHQCKCYSASSDGISGADSSSYICDTIINLSIHNLFVTRESNTIVLRDDDFRKIEYVHAKLISVMSLVLEGFRMSDKHVRNNYIFALFKPSKLKYISMIESTLHNPKLANAGSQFDWSQLEPFSSLEAILLERCTLTELSGKFSQIDSPVLSTIIIRSSELSYIDFEAFKNKGSLRKLVLSGNLISNLLWIKLLPTGTFKFLSHLDLSQNRLWSLPEDLHTYVPNLKVLYLDGNQFAFFTETSIKPWFNIDEARFVSTQGEGTNLLGWTVEMEWLKHLDDILSSFLIDSFVNAKYRASNGQYTWRYLSSADFLHHYPYQLYIDSENRLSYEDLQGKLTHLTIFGQNERLDQYFSFPKDSTPAEFEEHRVSLKRLIYEMEPAKHLIRFVWFNKQTIQQYQEANSYSSYLVPQVINFLDDAWSRKTRVLIIVLRSSDLDVDLKSDEEIENLSSFVAYQILTLLSQIQHHPALAGIELMESPFSRYLTPNQLDTKPIPAFDNQCPYDEDILNTNVAKELKFLKKTFQRLEEQRTLLNMLSLNVDANCVPCFVMATVSSCIDWPRDFITINSQFEKNDDMFSHLKVNDHQEEWFRLHNDQKVTTMLFIVHHSKQFQFEFTAIPNVIGYVLSFDHT